MQKHVVHLGAVAWLWFALLVPHSWAQTGCGPLRGDAQRLGFSIGAALRGWVLQGDKAYADIAARQFNVCTTENEFKFADVHPSRKTFSFKDGDRIVQFAQSNQIKVRGHSLVWHDSVPDWLANGNYTRDEVIDILHQHILTVVGRYKGRVWVWDVVNEPFNDSGSSLRTDSFWYQKIGPEYVSLAFQYAHEADPDAVLYLNEYGADDMGTKSQAVYDLVSSFKNTGVPIHGVGWQMHVGSGSAPGGSQHANAQRLAALGLEISVTELDVRLPLPVNAGSLAQQANTYRDVTAFCLSEPNCRALVMWGFTDAQSWIPNTFPGYGSALIYDSSLQPKPAYLAIQDELKGNTTQSPRISGAWIASRNLIVTGEGFQKGAAILLNGVPQKSVRDKLDPECMLSSKKAGKVITPGDTLQVQNPDGSFTNEITFE